MIQRVEIQNIKSIMLRLLPLLPLRHLDLAQIMRRIHITGLPAPRNLLAQIGGKVMVRQLLDIG